MDVAKKSDYLEREKLLFHVALKMAFQKNVLLTMFSLKELLRGITSKVILKSYS